MAKVTHIVTSKELIEMGYTVRPPQLDTTFKGGRVTCVCEAGERLWAIMTYTQEVL